MILKRIEKDHPEKASVQALLGNTLSLTGDKTGALAAFRKGKELMDKDKTVGGTWRYYIEQGLKELGDSSS